jgi:hypothetical protein
LIVDALKCRENSLRETTAFRMSMYIRIKRKNQTTFLHVESSSMFSEIKRRIAVNYSMEPANIMLFGNDKVRL